MRSEFNTLNDFPLDVVCKVDSVAREAELRWREGCTPRIEEYVTKLPCELRPLLLPELLALEIDNRIREGHRPAVEEYLQRFPDERAIVQRVFESLAPSGSHNSQVSEQKQSYLEIPGYEIIRKLGQGAMGTVYLARQVCLDRLVALKRITAPDIDWKRATEIVRNEAMVLAKLNHPQIVQVYEVSEDEQQPFLTLEYIDGETLRERISRQQLTVRQTAVLVEQLARAIHHAHTHGIVHRDLKPANVLLPNCDHDLVPKITDFGLAKVLDEMQDHNRTGVILGTPKYMAPEQAEGRMRDVGPATDVYALGTILFELLSGEPPFDSKSSLDLLRKIATQTAVFPDQSCKSVPVDLRLICLKCLEKEPKQRYTSAWELADDLRRFIDGFPVQVRPASTIDLSIKFVWRHKLATTLACITCVAMLAATVTSVLAAIKIERHRQQESALASNLALDRGMSLCEQGSVATGLLWMARSLESCHPGDVDFQRVVRINLASWSKRIGHRVATLPHQAAVTSIACSEVGNVVLTGSQDGTAKLWNLHTGRLIASLVHDDSVTCVTLSPDGQFALTGSKDKTARLWSTQTGIPVSPLWQHNEGVTSVSFRTDGQVALTGSSDTLARQWNVASGELIGSPLHHGTAILNSRFVAEGNQVITVGGTQAILWDAHSCVQIGEPLLHDFSIRSAAVSLDGTKLLTGGALENGQGKIRVWDTVSRQPMGEPLQFTSVVSCVALSNKGETALAGTQNGSMRLWRVGGGGSTAIALQHQNEVRAASFSTDGTRLLTGSFDGKSQLWDAATGEPLCLPLQHEHHVYCLALSSSGGFAMSGSEDGQGRIWNIHANQPLYRTLRNPQKDSPGESSMRVQFSPDGRLALTGNRHGAVQLWSVRAAQPYKAAMHHPSIVTASAFRADGKCVGIGCADGTVKLWDIVANKVMGAGKHRAEVAEIVFSADGRFAISVSRDHSAQLWDAQTGQRLGSPLEHPQSVWFANFSSDNQFVLTSSSDGVVREWDIATGRLTGRQLQHPYTPWEAEFSADNELVLTGCGPSAGSFGEARLWKINSATNEFGALRHFGAVAAVAWSPDQQLVLTGSFDHTAQLWSTQTCQPVNSPLVHRDKVWDVAFSPDGQIALTASDDRTARLWDVRTGKSLGVPFVHPVSVRNAVFSPDNSTILTGGTDDTARLWTRTESLAGSLIQIQAWVGMITGLKLDARGVARPLDPVEMEKLNRDLNDFEPYLSAAPVPSP